MIEYKSHPLAELFPTLGASEIKELAADIAANGQQVPVVLLEHNGEVKVLDGRNRLKACAKIEKEPITTMWDDFRRTLPNPEIAPLDWVVSTNIKRRHLNDGQREAIAAELISYREALETEKQVEAETNGELIPQTTEEQKVVDASAQMNVKPRNVRKARKVKSESPELHESVKAGHIKTGTAAKLGKMTKEQKKAIAKAAKDEKNRQRIEKIAAKQAAKDAREKAAADLKAGKKPRGGLAADKAKSESIAGFKKSILAGLEDLYTETESSLKQEGLAGEFTWQYYHKKVIARIKAID